MTVVRKRSTLLPLNRTTDAAKLLLGGAGCATLFERTHRLQQVALDIFGIGSVLPCASRRAGLEQDFLSVLKTFSPQPPLVAPKTLCCGFGGDVGLKDAALNKHALAGLIEAVRQQEGASTAVVSASRTCEIGLEWHLGRYSGIVCHSLFQWLDRRTEALNPPST